MSKQPTRPQKPSTPNQPPRPSEPRHIPLREDRPSQPGKGIGRPPIKK